MSDRSQHPSVLLSSLLSLQSTTRRQVLQAIGLAGGAAGAYGALHALGLIPRPERAPGDGGGTEPPPGNGQVVVILGAGLAGMAAAYELGKAGYRCHILEARTRAGGRCWTVRRGTVETETGGDRQECAFDDGLYMNPGPARIPHHHRAILGYCKEFGVALEVFVNSNSAAYYYHEARQGATGTLVGRKVRQREGQADLRGYIAELLGKAVARDALDIPLSGDDRSRLLDFLQQFGDLAPDRTYRGSERRGFRVEPGAGPEAGTIDPAFSLSALLGGRFGDHLWSEWAYDQQMTMFQPVGGMDQIARAFEARVGQVIQFGCAVREIRRTLSGVRVVYQDGTNNETREIAGDFCICTLPLTILKDIPADLAPNVRSAIGQVPYVDAMKVGFQFARRFWEEDEAIYGGITWTNLPILQLWYPSTGYHARKGVMLGMYAFGDDAATLGRLGVAERHERVLAQAEKIHPQARREVESAFSVAWQRIPNNQGCYALYSAQSRASAYPALQQSDGRIYLAGEHMSYLTGWQEGAILSAHAAVAQIRQRAATTTPQGSSF